VVQELQPGDPQVIGPYRLLGQLGGGGMGRVFLGLSAGGRRVAVKVVRPELAANPEFRVRFRREVAVARTVSGLFTAVVVDADVDAPAPWLATAYVAGPSLAQAVEAHGRLPADSVLALAAGLAESLAAIHGAGLVHRDLKPSNVLLAEEGPRVIDFGISRAVEATSLTSTGLVVGSPGFMSPEQAQGGVVGPPSDMFSLGAVLAFAATGEAPFGSGSTPALIYRVVHGAPDLSQVPTRVRPLIERCMAKDPGERPAADDFLAQIGPVQPVTGWLPEAVIRPVPEEPAPDAGAVPDPPAPIAVKDSQPTATTPGTDQTVTAAERLPSPQLAARPPRPGRGSRLRRRWSGLAWPLTALLLVLVVTVLALNAVGW
jgi:serine/threonine protein kinase